MLGLDALLSNPLAKTVATAFAGPLAPIGMDLLSSASKGGFDPLQSLLGGIGDPFKMLFPQVAGQLATPFPSTPAAFQSPVLGGTVDQLIQSLGDVEGRTKAAMEKLQSKDPKTQLEGQEELQAIARAIEQISKVSQLFSGLQKTITGNIVT